MAQTYWAVTSLTTKCPKCGTEYTDDNEKDARLTLRAVIECTTPGCGFKGTVD